MYRFYLPRVFRFCRLRAGFCCSSASVFLRNRISERFSNHLRTIIMKRIIIGAAVLVLVFAAWMIWGSMRGEKTVVSDDGALSIAIPEGALLRLTSGKSGDSMFLRG